MKTKDEIFVELLGKKVKDGKSIILKYSSRHELCRNCPNRFICITDNTKSCSVRKDVDKHLHTTKRFFKVYFN